ncbi:MAG: AAA family ATPase [Proteobacteria bacterium]|nr:AAA family ATPase [Pseudomonadota bacterium]
MDNQPQFSSLTVSQWRQFDSIEIEIHPRLTVLTGANGAGKTTLIGILTQHFGWSRPLLATPWRNSDGSVTYISGAFKTLLSWFSKKENPQVEIGKVGYTNGSHASLNVPTAGSVEYGVSINGQQSVLGLSVPSHRIMSRYQAIQAIPTMGISAHQAYNSYNSEILNRFQGGHTGFSPLFRMKEALISMATFGEGNKYVKGKPELLRSYLGFIDVLKKVLPGSLGFETIEIRTPDVVLVTKSGEFLLDSVSGGISALIDLAWQIHTFSHDLQSFAVVIDEPENHLHPSMQRSLLPSFLDAFPQAQFIVASHSPFIVTSVRDSNVYVLSYKEGLAEASLRGIAPSRSVFSTRLDHINKAATASEVLRTVLGLDSTMPLWATKELGQIIERYRSQPFTPEQVDQLDRELEDLGMSDSLPQAIDAIFQEPKP